MAWYKVKVIEKNLYSRNGYFYYRSAIPAFVRGFLSFKEMKIGLATKDLQEARVIAARLHYDIIQALRSFQHDLKALTFGQSPDAATGKFLERIEAIKGTAGYNLP